MKAFNEFAAEAAQLENRGQAKEAATAWRRAGAYSDNGENIEWCYARAGFCESRFMREAEHANKTRIPHRMRRTERCYVLR